MFFSLVPANSCQTLEILLLPFYKKALTDVCQRSGEHVSIYMIFLLRSPFCSTKTLSNPASIAEQNQQANSIRQHIAEKVWVRHRRRRKITSRIIRQSPRLGSGFLETQPIFNASPLCLGFVCSPEPLNSHPLRMDKNSSVSFELSRSERSNAKYYFSASKPLEDQSRPLGIEWA